jgi:hypothetical protein
MNFMIFLNFETYNFFCVTMPKEYDKKFIETLYLNYKFK